MYFLHVLQMLTMYHYTNRQGLDAIKKRGYITESNDAARDTSFGFGNKYWIKRTYLRKLINVHPNIAKILLH